MDRKQYYQWMKCLAGSYVIVIVFLAASVFFMTDNGKITLLVFGGSLVFCFLGYLIHYLDNRYITEVIGDLSVLMDVLVELEEKEVFPEYEDTILSKLQNKVIKLVRILKHKNRQAQWEHENMKQLVSDLSHQLKTPISNLKMYSRFLQDVSLPEKTRQEYIEVISISVDRLYFLTENMIKISRLESGLIQLKPQNQSVGETVLKALKDIYPKAKEKQVEISYREEAELTLYHDRNWTAEAVYNLLDNAVKYGSEGSLITVSVRKLGMFAEISVEDENGIIPEMERSKIFMRFYRGNNSRNREGVGVGLYLTRQIAVKQGGYVNLKASKKGNIFSVFLYCSKRESSREKK